MRKVFAFENLSSCKNSTILLVGCYSASAVLPYFECASAASAVAIVCSNIKDSWLQIKIPYDLFYFKPTAAFTLYGLPNTAPTAMETFPKRIIDEESYM